MVIKIYKPEIAELESKEILNWPIWTCEPSEFNWFYEEKETCYLLTGKVTVTTDSESITFSAGDLVTFPKGLACVWKVEETVKKHYKFG